MTLKTILLDYKKYLFMFLVPIITIGYIYFDFITLFLSFILLILLINNFKISIISISDIKILIFYKLSLILLILNSIFSAAESSLFLYFFLFLIIPYFSYGSSDKNINLLICLIICSYVTMSFFL